MANTTPNSTGQSTLVQITDQLGQVREDAVAVEEPLEIRLYSQGHAHVLTVTMRTPGDDEALAAGFLLAEDVIDDVADIREIRPCGASGRALRVELHDGCMPRLKAVARNFAATSSCGFCGKTSFDDTAVRASTDATEYEPHIYPAALRRLPSRLRESQWSFLATGGLHAVAAFTASGDLVRSFEDIGRHNAFDKLVGATALAGEHLRDSVVLLSGRAGYEMVQKAAAARVPVLAAIGAPSSLAVQLADRAGITLIGFLREDKYNAYTHAGRLHAVGAPHSREVVA
jgi:FdhD protein